MRWLSRSEELLGQNVNGAGDPLHSSHCKSCALVKKNCINWFHWSNSTYQETGLSAHHFFPSQVCNLLTCVLSQYLFTMSCNCNELQWNVDELLNSRIQIWKLAKFNIWNRQSDTSFMKKKQEVADIRHIYSSSTINSSSITKTNRHIISMLLFINDKGKA